MVAHTISAAFVVNTTTDVSTKSSTFAAKKATWNNYTKNPLKMLSVTMQSETKCVNDNLLKIVKESTKMCGSSCAVVGNINWSVATDQLKYIQSAELNY